MHIQLLRLPFRQDPFDIGKMLRPKFGIDLLDTRAEFHWPVGDLQLIKGTAYILRDVCQTWSGLPD